MRFDGRVAIVTGASRGLGRAIALKLGKLGAKVVVNYRSRPQQAEEVVGIIEASGSEAVAIMADVSLEGSGDILVQAAMEAYGRVDILVNNAGITRDSLLLRMSEADWCDVLDINLKSVFRCSKAVLRPMLRQRYGRIINISSVSGISGNAGQTNYSAAKAGLIGFTKALAREVASRNITVNAVAPGFIETDLTADLPVGLREKALDAIAMGRMGAPEDVAPAVAFLASEEAGYITGQTLRVDGGLGM